MTSFLPVYADSKFPRSGEERLWSRSLNQKSPWGTQRVIDQYLCSVSPTRSSRGLSTPPVEPLNDPMLPKEQAGFRRGKSTVDQVVLLTQNIENFLEAKRKTGAVFVNLTAAYHTIWHRGLTCKLLRLLSDKHMVRMIMELVRNRNFTLITGDSKQSRLRRLKNGVPQGSVLAPLLFNIYTYDITSVNSRKFAYADDLALLK